MSAILAIHLPYRGKKKKERRRKKEEERKKETTCQKYNGLTYSIGRP